MTPTPTRGVTLQNGGLQFNANLYGWSLGDVGQCRLVDYFNVAPTGSLSDPQAKLALHLVSCTWGQKGHLWLEQSLTAGGTFHLLGSGASGSLALDNRLMWQPVRELQITLSFTLNGVLDSNTGFQGSVNLGGNMRMLDTRATMLGVGLRF
ncbi:MAG: hypothetical protein ACRD0A_13305 [Acidimicrobiales bacterium]